MPIYEYRCRACRQKVTILTLRASAAVDAACDHCGSRDLTRLMSRFAMLRSDEDRLEDLADSSALGEVDESDPKSMARWMRKMGKELGEDAGQDFDQVVDELEAGDEGDAGDDDVGGDDL